MTPTINAMVMTTTAMTSAPTHWFSPATMQALGWALLHFLWQGTALAAVAAAAMALCRRASARYLVAVGALVLTLLAPLTTFFFYAQQFAAQQHSGVADTAKSSPLAAAEVLSVARGTVAARGSTQNLAPPPGRNSLPMFEAWLVEAWLLGVAFFSLRSAGGFLLLERERRRHSSVVSPRVLEICLSLQHRLGLDRAIAYCECAWLQAPAVIGWFRPVVFLPMTALSGLSEEQLSLVIAHELAHIQRFDPFVNVFQVCVETLLFYHPAVWWLNKRIRAEREHCCDDIAVALCGNAVEYARALTLMEEWRSAPAFAMAANRGPLSERVIRVLGLKTLGAGMRGIGLTGSMLCLGAALVAGNALLGMAHPSTARAASISPPQQADSRKPSAAHPQSAASSVSSSSSASAAATASSSSAASAAASVASSSADASGQTALSSATSYIDAMKAAGFNDLSIDQLIALKTQDVTPEYVKELHDLGLQPDIDTLIAMRVQDISPEYVRGWRDAGLTPELHQLIALKIQGADGAYYRAMKDAGLRLDVDTLIGMKVQDVTPEYVREIRAAGLVVNANQLIGLKVQDVTPEYVKAMHDLGIEVRTDDMMGMKVQDVTPEYVRAIQALGFRPSASELIGMKVQDVTPEYIKALQSAGFKVGIGDVIGAKVQDVTPEFIERAKSHGFKDLTLQKLIRLRELGILDSKADL